MMTYIILIATVVVSIACFNNYSLFNKLSCNPYRMVHSREWYRIISHGFVHADWTHLIVNMFTFLSFGLYVENQFVAWGFGSSSFLILYFGGMVAASVYDVWKYRNNQYYSSIGASGAVSSVLFTAIFLHPWIRSTSSRSFRFPVSCLVLSTCFIANTWQNEMVITSIITPTSMERCTA